MLQTNSKRSNILLPLSSVNGWMFLMCNDTCFYRLSEAINLKFKSIYFGYKKLSSRDWELCPKASTIFITGHLAHSFEKKRAKIHRLVTDQKGIGNVFDCLCYRILFHST